MRSDQSGRSRELGGSALGDLGSKVDEVDRFRGGKPRQDGYLMGEAALLSQLHCGVV